MTLIYNVIMKMHHMKLALVILISLSFYFCSSTVQQATKEQKTVLKLTVHPRQGFIPLMTVLEAELVNYQSQEDKYSCLKEEWDFGDGNKSQHQPDCKSSDKFKTKFIITHEYQTPGTYKIYLTLGDKLLKSQAVWISVYYSGT